VLEGWPTLPPRLHHVVAGLIGPLGVLTFFGSTTITMLCTLSDIHAYGIQYISSPIDNFFLSSLFDDRHCCHRIHVFIFGTLSSVTGFLSLPEVLPQHGTMIDLPDQGPFVWKIESTTMQMPSSCQGAPSQLNLGQW